MNIIKKIISAIALVIIALTGVSNAWGNVDFDHIMMRGWRLTNDTVFHDTICEGEDYEGHGFTFTQPTPGLHLDSARIERPGKPDSIVYMSLYVGAVYNIEYYEYICEGEIYQGHGFDVQNPHIGLNIEEHTGTSRFGCDSVVVLKLTVNEVYNTEIESTICYGQDYNENGFHFTRPTVGNHHHTLSLVSQQGCDSIITLELIVNPTYNFRFTDTICFGEDYYENGFHLTQPTTGWHYDTLKRKTKLGCDSIRSLQLFVANVYDTLFTETTCEGMNYNKHGFHLTNLQAGQHLDTLRNESLFGCDSITRLDLMVYPTYDTLFTDTICHGEEYNEHGFNLTNLSVGWHRDTIFGQSVWGCDSIICLALYTAPNKTKSFNDITCFNEGYHDHGFDYDSLPVGMFYDTAHYATAFGCDSAVSLTLYVAPIYDTLFRDTTCFGEGYNKHGFELTPDSLQLGMNVKRIVYPSIYECDSTVRLRLYVAPVYDTLFGDTICEGEDYTEHGFSLFDLSAGWHHDTVIVPSMLGCDSVLRLDLYAAPSPIVNIYDTICYGEHYQGYGFDTVNAPVGQHLLTKNKHTHFFHCDSLVRLHLTVGALYDYTITDTICYGESYHEYNFHYDTPEVGHHYDTSNLISMHRCDSVVKLDLYVGPVYNIYTEDTICYGDNYSYHGLNIIRPLPGVYDTITNIHTMIGCDSIYDIRFHVIHKYAAPDSISGDTLVFISTNITTGVYDYSIVPIAGCDNYKWSLWRDSTYMDSTFLVPNTTWILTQNKNTCQITVGSGIESVLKVEAANFCGTVSKSVRLKGTFYSVGETNAIDAAIYPNPTRDVINIECENIETVNIYNMSGQIVKSDRFGIDNKVEINVGELNASLYILEIITREGRCMKQFSKIY